MRTQTKGALGVLAFGMAVLAAVAFIGASAGDLADDPCGGHYVGQGLKASYSSSYLDRGVTYNSAFLNDLYIEGSEPPVPVYYEYRIPDGECVFYYRRGHIHLGINVARAGRFVNMIFEGTPDHPDPAYPEISLCAPNPYFIAMGQANTSEFHFRTTGRLDASRDGQGRLVLTGASVTLDLMAMVPGETAYCGIWCDYRIMDDAATETIDEDVDQYDLSQEPVQVYCGMIDGVLKWVIRPISETYIMRTVTKAKGKTVIVDSDPSPNTLWRSVISGNRRGCKHGTYFFPFELVLERLN